MIKRYSIKEIEKIFSDSNKFKIWLDIEVLALKYLQRKGVIDNQEGDRLISDLVVVPHQVRKKEKKTNHDVVAFINHIASTSSIPAKKWIHYGLTSSDLVDTANAVMLKQANKILIEEIHDLLQKLKRLAFVHRNSYCVNRVRGKEIDGATSFGYRIALYFDDINKGLEELEKYRKYIECASISGSMGISSHTDLEEQEYIAKELGLYSIDCSSQVISRDRYYIYFSLINGIIQSINRLALELRLQTRSEIGEVSEVFYLTQVGSSSMPHKKNPITLEKICGLSRLFNSYVSTTSKNIPIWLERDLSHSSVDRVVFVDGLSIAIHIIKSFTKTMKNLRVDTERMKKNIEINEFSVYTKYIRRTIYSKLKDFMTINEIDEQIANFQAIATRNKISYKEAFKENDIATSIGKDAFNEMFNLNAQLYYIDNFYKKIFSESIKQNNFDTIFYEKTEILEAVNSIARKLNAKYPAHKGDVRVIAFRDESVVFISQLLPKLNFGVELVTIDVSEQEYLLKEGKLISGKDFTISQDLVKKHEVVILGTLLKDSSIVSVLKRKIEKLGAKGVYTVMLFSSAKEEIIKHADLYGLPIPSTEGVAGFGIGNVNGEFRNYSFVGKLKVNLQY